MPRAVVISNGQIGDYSFYRQSLCADDFIICADGAVRHMASIGILPDVWLGDFDSCNRSDVTKSIPGLENVDTIKLNPEKDVTDTHYACNLAIEKGYDTIVIWGAFGGRIDHMLSNLHLLEFLKEKGIAAIIEDEKNTVRLCDSSITLSKKRKYLSIIPLDSDVFIEETKGLKYPLKNYKLPRSVSMGVSNEITDASAFISIKSGRALVIESDD